MATQLKNFTEIIIDAVRERPILWDSRLNDYHNRTAVDNEWADLASTFDINSK